MPGCEEGSSLAPWDGKALFLGSCRDALRSLLEHGIAEFGWRRLWVPAYYCQEVVASFLSTGLTVMAYPDGPNERLDIQRIDAKAGDVVLLVDFFGLRSRPSLAGFDRTAVQIIEDHTHDPWSRWAWTSEADWCVASIRKVLPLPDGGVLWSPVGYRVPPSVPVSSEHALASQERFLGMLLKRLYLAGHPVDKATFRRLALSGESRMVASRLSGITGWSMSLLSTFPIDLWREQRRANHQLLGRELASVPWLKVLQPDESSMCPFSLIILCDSQKRRNRVREGLIESAIYPATLWALDQPVIAGIGPNYSDFSKKMLSIHCDMRYSKDEMEYVAQVIRRIT